MRLLHFIFILAVGQIFLNCTHKSDAEAPQFITEHITITEEVEDVSPPDSILISPFRTLQEWLVNICDREMPAKAIATFRFGLFESHGEYTLFLVGLNNYDLAENHSAIRIEFEPTHMYFQLPENEYKNLKRDQVVERLTVQLKAFTKTDKFKHSFLADAKAITTDFSGEIWSK